MNKSAPRRGDSKGTLMRFTAVPFVLLRGQTAVKTAVKSRCFHPDAHQERQSFICPRCSCGRASCCQRQLCLSVAGAISSECWHEPPGAATIICTVFLRVGFSGRQAAEVVIGSPHAQHKVRTILLSMDHRTRPNVFHDKLWILQLFCHG